MSVEPTTAPAANAESGQPAAPPTATNGAESAPAAAPDKQTDAKPSDKSAAEATTAGQQTAAMVRREQELVKKAQEAARERAEIAKERESLKAQLADAENYRKILAAAKENPLGAAELLNLDYDAITRQKLERAKAVVTPDDLKRELDQREKARQEAESQRAAAAERAALEAQAKEVQEALDGYMAEARVVMDATPDAYELLRDHASVFGAEKAEDLVVKIAREHFAEARKTNPKAKAPTAKEANDLAEKWLEDRAKKLLSAKKLAPPPAEKAKPPVSLTNDLGASATGRVDTDDGTRDADFGTTAWAVRRAREIENARKT